jgi:hypothetical protein
MACSALYTVQICSKFPELKQTVSYIRCLWQESLIIVILFTNKAKASNGTGQAFLLDYMSLIKAIQSCHGCSALYTVQIFQNQSKGKSFGYIRYLWSWQCKIYALPWLSVPSMLFKFSRTKAK